MAILSNSDLRNKLKTKIPSSAPYNPTKTIKEENINSFNSIPRLPYNYGNKELRLYLYETLLGERVGIQLPGKETIRTTRTNPNDFRPIIQLKNGDIYPDMDFKMIWDKIDILAARNQMNSDILGILFLRIAYMLEYTKTSKDYDAVIIDIPSSKEIPTVQNLTWNHIDYDNDILETLNDMFGLIDKISIEALIYYNDLLAQNEDCKYSYLKGSSWQITQGRINNCLSHLSIISHCRGNIGISKLLDMFQRTGVGPLPQRDFRMACGSLIETY